MPAAGPRVEWTPGLLPRDLMIMVFQLAGRRVRKRIAATSRWFVEVIQHGRSDNIFNDAVKGCVSAGGEYSAICTEERELYTFGRAASGVLGHDEDYENWDCELVPRLVQGLRGVRVVSVSAGQLHTAVCTEEGRLYTFGAGNALGHGGGQNELVPRLVRGLADMKVVAVAAGWHHTVVHTDRGWLFTFGLGEHGRLGHGGEESWPVPRMVEQLVLRRVVAVAAGCYHTAVCTHEGRLYTCGRGAYGRLGHGRERNKLVPRWVKTLREVRVVAVAAGEAHTVVCTEEGRLYTCGRGLAGRLGHGGEQNELVPRLVEGLQGLRVVGVATGDTHTAVCTEEGRLYTFGYEAIWGKRGHGGCEPGEQSELVPRLVEGLGEARVVAVAVGNDHTMAYTEEEELYTFGNGQFGQVGHGGRLNETVPRLVSFHQPRVFLRLG